MPRPRSMPDRTIPPRAGPTAVGPWWPYTMRRHNSLMAHCRAGNKKLSAGRGFSLFASILVAMAGVLRPHCGRSR